FSLSFSHFALIFLGSYSKGQIIVVTNSGSGLAATYPSFAAAITALNAATINSPVIISCAAGGTEIFSSSTAGNITATGSAVNPIIIQKIGSGANPLITAAVGTSTTIDAIIKIGGGDYITIDGIDLKENIANTNVTNQMEFGYYISNASATNGAQYNTIKNCKITLDRTNTTTKAVYQNVTTTPTNSSGANSYNKYQFITVENTYNGIYFVGSTTYNDMNLEISNCIVGANTANDIGNGSALQANGIRTAYSNNISIFNNEVRNVCISSGGQTLFGIYLNSLQGNSNNVYNNKVHDIQTLSTNVLSIVAGIRADIQTGAKCNIYNNMIFALQHGIFTPTSTMVIYGIGVSLNGTGTGNIFYNSVRIDEDEFPTSTGLFIGAVAGTVNIKNNIFANYSLAGITSLRYCIFKQTTSILNSVNHNNYYINTSGTNNKVGSYNAIDQNTLTNWQTSSSKDAASLNINPAFVSVTDLHSTNSYLNAAAICISTANGDDLNITSDFDGDLRDALTPDIGADEFTIAPVNPCNGTPSSASINGSAFVCSGNSTLLSLNTTYNFLGIKYQWKYSTVSGGPYTNMDTLSTQITGSINATKYYICTITCINSGLSFTTPEKTVGVTIPPSATIAYTGSPYCKTLTNSQAVTLTGTAGGTYTALPSGLSINSTTGAITPSMSNAGIYTITYKIDSAGGCAAFTTTASAIITAPPSATISYTGSPFCKTLTNSQAVTLTGTAGGTYTALPSGLSINSTTGAITPSSSSVGTYTVTYSIAATGGCTAVSTTTTVSIVTSPSATISYTGSPFCKSVTATQNVTLTGNAGGIFSYTPTGLNLSLNTSTGAIVPSSSSAGTYIVTYTIAASGGCPAVSTTAQVSINPLPANAAVITSINNDSVNPGENNLMYFVPVIANATSYIWSYSGSGATFIPASTTVADSVKINFSANATSGNLTVKGHNACGDGFVSASYPIFVALGIGEIANTLNYRIFPNPTSGKITINISGIKNNIDLKIINMQGKEIYFSKIINNNQSHNQEIDLSSFSKGVYFVKIMSKNFIKVEKMVLQ
ncbi:MAG: T9SS type A sorting domain-containing protein, partial [Bacteroidales bacterium]